MPYTIGIDFGTESGRVLLLDLTTGRELAVRVVPYPHGVIEDVFYPTGKTLPPSWALQDPDDYIKVVLEGIPAVLGDAEIEPNQVIGIGIDFTACTVMPVTTQGTPLCQLPQWRNRPHAWPKLWKHHAAQSMADRINQKAHQRKESFLARYGGSISSEWYFPKLLQVFAEDREVYDACDAFVEAADWIVWFLTGEEHRNSCTAGFKATWHETNGIPSTEYFRSVNSEFTNPAEKLGNTFHALGSKAGSLRPELAHDLGLSQDVAVAVGNVDAHVSFPAAGVHAPGTMVMVLGTSLCHLWITDDEVPVPGITGVVKDGVIPGYFGYEAGQAAVGDMYGWFVKRAVPQMYFEAASARGVSIYTYLEERATLLQPGEHGLVALDWWNGNRSTLGDLSLSGMLMGLTLDTTAEHIYRALLESTAFGTKRIIDTLQNHGIPIHELVACGGIAHRSPLLLQIYADVCGLPVIVHTSTEIPARGAALFGAVAAGSRVGGFESVADASKALRPDVAKTYVPNPAVQGVYKRLFGVYSDLYTILGVDKVDLAHTLRDIRMAAQS